MTKSTSKGERPQKKTSLIVQPGLTYRPQQLEVDVEPKVKKRSNRSKALVTLH